MATKIHPHALVEKGARLDDGVVIGPYAIVANDATIQKGTQVDAFAQVLGNTTIGKNCHIFSYAVIGSAPQDLKYTNEKSFLTVGNNNTIREFVTINPGTEKDSLTCIGNNNLIMAYSHVAHNCILGDNNVFANGATLAGHVEIQDKVVIGGLVAIHQFCKVGKFSIIGGCSKVVQDIPPYSMCDGHPARVYGLNTVGLRRGKFAKDTIDALKKAFKLLFFENHPVNKAKELIAKECQHIPELEDLLDFVSSSKRGISK